MKPARVAGKFSSTSFLGGVSSKTPTEGSVVLMDEGIHPIIASEVHESDSSMGQRRSFLNCGWRGGAWLGLG
jgi:hypothetical protein